MNLRRILYLYLPLALAAVAQNLVHEGLHFLLARALGVEVLEFRFLTNGWLTSQVIYAAPMETRSGAEWLVIGLGPAVVTVLIGYAVYLLRRRLLTRWPALNLLVWYVGALFITIDPLYVGLLSWFMQGSDVNAVQAVGWPVWPVRLVGLAAAAVGSWLVVNWRTEARRHVENYALAAAGRAGG